MGEQIIVYTQYHCATCDKVKSVLKQQDVEYVERNIVEDESAMNELMELGVMSVPVTIMGEDVMLGYNRKKLDGMIKRYKEA